MPLSRDDEVMFDHLAQADKLYERYLETARLSDLSVLSTIETVEVPPPPGTPLGLEIRTDL